MGGRMEDRVDKLQETFDKIDALPTIVTNSCIDMECLMIGENEVALGKGLALRLFNLFGDCGVPHVTTEGNGEVTLDWWKNHTTLSVWVAPNADVSYLYAWGVNMWSDMEDKSNPTDKELLNVWQRFQGIELVNEQAHS